MHPCGPHGQSCAWGAPSGAAVVLLRRGAAPCLRSQPERLAAVANGPAWLIYPAVPPLLPAGAAGQHCARRHQDSVRRGGRGDASAGGWSCPVGQLWGRLSGAPSGSAQWKYAWLHTVWELQRKCASSPAPGAAHPALLCTPHLSTQPACNLRERSPPLVLPTASCCAPLTCQPRPACALPPAERRWTRRH